MVDPKNHRNSPKKCVCGAPSLKGLTVPMCAYAWAKAHWGEAWANEHHPNHPHRVWQKPPRMVGLLETIEADACANAKDVTPNNLRVKSEQRYPLPYVLPEGDHE